ncbi:MAG: hypothetical protein IT305_21445 [Chloroflexi bacterium]|nr:hypothetical protein [Chloroflexota bacterium]
MIASPRVHTRSGEPATPGPASAVVSLSVYAGALTWALGVGLLFFYLLVYLVHTYDLALYPLDVDQGEGYDVNSGWLLAQGRPIYTDNEQFPYYSSNYPPVYSLLLAPIVAETGPSLLAGRLLSAGAALLTTVLLGSVAYRWTGNAAAAATAALLYIGSSYVFHTTPLARVNALAVLFALAALACCAERGRMWAAAAVAACLLALYTKQTTVDAVAAGLLALALRNLRLGVVVGAAVAAIGGALFLAIDRTTGGAFYENVVVGNVNPFRLGQAVDYYANFLQIHGIMVGLAGWQVWQSMKARSLGAFELYWLFSLILAVSVGKWGAGESYFLGPIVASALLAGLGLHRIAAAPDGRAYLLAIVGPLVLLQSVLYAHGPLYRLAPFLADHGAQASVLGRAPDVAAVAAASELLDALQKGDGPLLLEDPSYGLYVGREVVGNATHLRNLYQAGVWSPDGLVEDIRARRFDWVLLHAELYPEPVLQAIGRSYYLYEEYEVNGTRQLLFAPGAE